MDLGIQAITDTAVSQLEQRKAELAKEYLDKDAEINKEVDQRKRELAAEYQQKGSDLDRAIAYLRAGNPSPVAAAVKAAVATTEATKECSVCHQFKPLSAFNKVRKNGDQLYSICRDDEHDRSAKIRADKKARGECLECTLPATGKEPYGDYCKMHKRKRKKKAAERAAAKKSTKS